MQVPIHNLPNMYEWLDHINISNGKLNQWSHQNAGWVRDLSLFHVVSADLQSELSFIAKEKVENRIPSAVNQKLISQFPNEIIQPSQN